MPIAFIILLIVLLAITCRKFSDILIPIWLITAFGAILCLILRQITPVNAAHAIEPNVMLYLLGVFFISQAAESSGYLEQLTDTIFYKAKRGRDALLIIVFVLGLSAALLMNDSLAILCTPIILQLCKSHKKLLSPLLLALAFAITIGSVPSPIGNPQNLLIAVKSGMTSPFIEFIKVLAIPTLINLVITYLLIYWIYRDVLKDPVEKPTPQKVADHTTVNLVKISLILFLFLIIIKIATEFSRYALHLNLSYIALISALPLLLSKQRWKFLRDLDWGTLIFFASIFTLVQSVWNSGFFQNYIQHFHASATQISAIITLSTVLSQFISNVPLVSLYLPLLINQNLSNLHFLALACGSTIAGNLTIFGAASNIIIIQNTEKRHANCFEFFEFLKLGLPLTCINIAVYLFFIWASG